eukprot:355732-Chlamydomonas_euryale.AAC.1
MWPHIDEVPRDPGVVAEQLREASCRESTRRALVDARVLLNLSLDPRELKFRALQYVRTVPCTSSRALFVRLVPLRAVPATAILMGDLKQIVAYVDTAMVPIVARRHQDGKHVTYSRGRPGSNVNVKM